MDARSIPTALTCGYFQSGVRVFDITNLTAPRELADINPPAQVGKRAELSGCSRACHTRKYTVYTDYVYRLTGHPGAVADDTERLEPIVATRSWPRTPSCVGRPSSSGDGQLPATRRTTASVTVAAIASTHATSHAADAP